MASMRDRLDKLRAKVEAQSLAGDKSLAAYHRLFEMHAFVREHGNEVELPLELKSSTVETEATIRWLQGREGWQGEEGRQIFGRWLEMAWEADEQRKEGNA